MIDCNDVKIIGITLPLNEFMTPEEFIAYCARVSNPTNQNNKETSAKLLKYLIRNKHWSPFEMVNVVMEIETTRDIGRQILRHRSFSFQEFSQRYAYAADNVCTVVRETRLQDTKNRQNSLETQDQRLRYDWEENQENARVAALKAYQWAIDNGIAKEQARAVLPEGLVLSKIYMSGSVRSWYHYVEVRTDPSTQKEHRDVALKCKNELAKHFPVTFGDTV